MSCKKGFIHSLKISVGLFSTDVKKLFVVWIFSVGLFSVAWTKPIKSETHILTEIERHQGCILYFDAGYFEKETLSNCYFCNLINCTH